jgi:hypothetical protein
MNGESVNFINVFIQSISFANSIGKLTERINEFQVNILAALVDILVIENIDTVHETS